MAVVISSAPTKRGNNAFPLLGSQYKLIQAGNLDKRTRDLYRLVFGIDMLREIILDFVVHDHKGQLIAGNAHSCRLVQRAWLESVTKCLLKSGQPLLKFSLSTNFKFDKDPTFGQFLKVYSSSSRVLDRVPPFKLGVSFGPRQIKEKQNAFKNCLHFCNSGLVNLRLEFSLLGIPIDHPLQILDTNESLSLQKLKNLSLKFFYGTPNSSDDDGVLYRNITSVVQSILSASTNLTCFCLEGSFTSTGNVPMNFKNLHLPPTLTQLEIAREMTNEQLEQLMMNNLFPRLTQLTLFVPKVSNGGSRLIYQILERVCRTLRNLKMKGVRNDTTEEQVVTPLTLPVMPCLESVFVHATSCQLVDVVLDQHLPNVKKMKLQLASPKMLRMKDDELYVELAKYNSALDFSNEVTLPLAKWLHQTFANVTKLSISTAFSSIWVHAPLQYLFQNMTQLEKLSLTFIKTSRVRRKSTFWQSLFLGVPITATASAQLPFCRPFSIENLSELNELELCLLDSRSNFSVLLDSVFEYAFLNMPKLFHLKLNGKFRASPAMIKRWGKNGRLIQIHSPPHL